MHQAIRYALVGVVTNIALYIFYLVLTHFGFGSKRSMTVVYFFGAIVGFLGNRKWTFAYNKDFTGSAFRFTLAHIFGYCVNFLMLFIFVDCLQYSHQIVQAIAVGVVACFIFFISKYFIFRERV